MFISVIQREVDNKAAVSEIIAEEAESRGNAYDCIAELENKIGSAISLESTAAAIIDDIKSRRERPDTLLVPGTIDLIATIKSMGAQCLFLTAGGVKTQVLKLKVISELLKNQQRFVGGIPWVVIDTAEQRKTQLANEAYDELKQEFSFERLLQYAKASNGMDSLQGGGVTTVMVIDDKPQNTVAVTSSRVVGVLVEVAEREPDAVQRLSLQEVANSIVTHATDRLYLS